eukprot:353871-Chlamydomonas_euryale.AAC.2
MPVSHSSDAADAPTVWLLQRTRAAHADAKPAPVGAAAPPPSPRGRGSKKASVTASAVRLPPSVAASSPPAPSGGALTTAATVEFHTAESIAVAASAASRMETVTVAEGASAPPFPGKITVRSVELHDMTWQGARQGAVRLWWWWGETSAREGARQGKARQGKGRAAVGGETSVWAVASQGAGGSVGGERRACGTKKNHAGVHVVWCLWVGSHHRVSPAPPGCAPATVTADQLTGSTAHTAHTHMHDQMHPGWQHITSSSGEGKEKNHPSIPFLF